MKVFLENDLLQLVYTQSQDIPFVMNTECDPSNTPYISQWSYEQHLDAISDTNILHLLIRDKDLNNVGHVIVRGLSDINNSIELFRIAIMKKNCGYGQSVFSLLKTWCFEVQKAHRLWLDLRDHNTRALHIYTSQGFKTEGVLRECVKVGDAYESLIIMSMLSHEYPC